MAPDHQESESPVFSLGPEPEVAAHAYETAQDPEGAGIVLAGEDYANEPGAHLWRLGRGDLLAAGSSVFLLVSQFLPWFSGTRASMPGAGAPPVTRIDGIAAGGWHWMSVLVVVALLGYLGARTYPGEGRRIPLPHWQLLGIATGLNMFLVVLGMFLPPDGGRWHIAYGAIISLVAAACAAAGAALRREEPELMSPPVYETDGEAEQEHAEQEHAEQEHAEEERQPELRRRSREQRRPEERQRRPEYRPQVEARVEARVPLHSARARSAIRREAEPQAAPRHTTYQPTGKMCMICGAENPESRRVCKTCGVSLLSRSDR